MPSKFTFFFTSAGYRWTEDHYNQSGFTNIAQSQLLAQPLMGVRVQALGVGAALHSVRVSAVAPTGDVADVYTLLNMQPTWPSASPLNSAAVSFIAALIRLTASEGTHRNYYLAGAPYGIFRTVPGSDRGIDLNQVPDWANRYVALMSYLTNAQNGWGWMTRTETAFTPAAGPLVTNAAFPGMVGIQVAGVIPNVTLGVQVLVKGWRRISRPGGKRLSGVYRIGGVLAPVSPSTLTTYFLYNTPQVVPLNFKTIGLIGLYTSVFLQYAVNGFALEACVTRKRGATAYSPKGKNNNT